MKNLNLFLILLFIVSAALFTTCKKKDTTPTPVRGCMDPAADNYNSLATESDGNCKYSGCTDPNAFNYNSTANTDDGSCELAPKKLLIMNFTATWCWTCGAYGEEGFENAVNALSSSVIGITAHYSSSDPLYSSAANDLKTQIITSGSVPCFSEADSMVMVGAPSNLNGLTNLYTPFADATLQKPFVVNTYLTKTISSGKIKVDAKTKFFAAATGDYYLALYVLEDNIIAAQTTDTGTISNFKHNYVLRVAMTPTFGENIVTGSAASGAIINKSYEWPISTSWKSANLYVVSVIWKKELSGKYTYVNAYMKK